MNTLSRVFTIEELIEKNRDTELNAEIEWYMNRKMYEVVDGFRETINTTIYKIDALDLHSYMTKGKVYEYDMVNSEVQIIKE